MFALPISKPRFKRIIFYQNRPKIKSFLQKKCKIFERAPRPPYLWKSRIKFYQALYKFHKNKAQLQMLQIQLKGQNQSDQKSENQVCLSMFLNTFSVSHKKVKAICNKKIYSTGMIIVDQKGKHGQQRKVSKEALDCIEEHLESFPAYRSHYSRKDTDKIYLCPSLCLSEMYRRYVIECSKNNLQPQKNISIARSFMSNIAFRFILLPRTPVRNVIFSKLR